MALCCPFCLLNSLKIPIPGHDWSMDGIWWHDVAWLMLAVRFDSVRACPIPIPWPNRHLIRVAWNGPCGLKEEGSRPLVKNRTPRRILSDHHSPHHNPALMGITLLGFRIAVQLAAANSRPDQRGLPASLQSDCSVSEVSVAAGGSPGRPCGSHSLPAEGMAATACHCHSSLIGEPCDSAHPRCEDSDGAKSPSQSPTISQVHPEPHAAAMEVSHPWSSMTMLYIMWASWEYMGALDLSCVIRGKSSLSAHSIRSHICVHDRACMTRHLVWDCVVTCEKSHAMEKIWHNLTMQVHKMIMMVFTTTKTSTGFGISAKKNILMDKRTNSRNAKLPECLRHHGHPWPSAAKLEVHGWTAQMLPKIHTHTHTWTSVVE